MRRKLSQYRPAGAIFSPDKSAAQQSNVWHRRFCCAVSLVTGRRVFILGPENLRGVRGKSLPIDISGTAASRTKPASHYDLNRGIACQRQNGVNEELTDAEGSESGNEVDDETVIESVDHDTLAEVLMDRLKASSNPFGERWRIGARAYRSAADLENAQALSERTRRPSEVRFRWRWDLLPVADNLERAIAASAGDGLAEGVQMVLRLFHPCWLTGAAFRCEGAFRPATARGDDPGTDG